jgi:hypothetical protein
LSTCIPAHALLSAVVARLQEGGDTNEKELAAVIGSGVPRADVETAFAKSDAPSFVRAREALARVTTP